MNSPGDCSQEDDDGDSYDYEELDDFVEHDIEIAERNRCEDFKYVRLDVQEVQEVLNKSIQQLCMLIDVPPTVARLFLINSAWHLGSVKSQFLSDPIGFMIKQNLLPAKTASASISDSPAVMTALRTGQRLHASVRPYFSIPKLPPDSLCPICFTEPLQPETPIDFLCADPTSTSQARLSGRTQSQAVEEIAESGHDFPVATSAPIESSDSTSYLYGLSCGHRFCSDCWSSYLSVQLSESATNPEVCCMSDSCNLTVPEDFLLALLPHPNSREKYLSNLFTRMVSTHPSLRFCTGPDCSMIIRALEPVKARLVRCSTCHHEFCFACGFSYHAPTSCSDMKQWWSKCHSDSSTAKYIAAYTKDCPFCHVCIEKDGGCNHMGCSKCHHEFCWVCLKAWDVTHQCSRYNEDEDAKNEKSRESLRRYLFYYERWANHDQSLQLEKKHREMVLERINTKIMNKQGTWIDWQHLITAADTLRNCRYTLKFTYPRAFYAEHTDRKALFEYQQALLESEVEDLAWKIEHSELPDRAALQNAMDVCEKHRLALLQQFLD